MSSPTNHIEPRVDIWENERTLFILAELPGVRLENMSLLLRSNGLELEAPRSDGTNLVYRRTLEVPRNLDGDSIDACLRAGLLRIKIPKQSYSPVRVAVTSTDRPTS
jgi:HSP20 family molecular chaperone IbpA